MKTCRSCVHLKPFELTDEINTCIVVNIRIHVTTARFFGCNLHEQKPRRRPKQETTNVANQPDDVCGKAIRRRCPE